MDLTRDAIEKIEELATPTEHEFDELPGRHFTSKELHEVRARGKRPALLKVGTLNGVLGYIKNNLDNEKKRTIVINSPTKISLYGEYEEETDTRPLYLDSMFDYPTYVENFTSQESFIIDVLTKFKDTKEREELLKIAGNMSNDTSVKQQDDGVSQNVTVKTGITRLAEKDIKNPIMLKPFVTFPDIEQPDVLFNFRVKKSDYDNKVAMCLISCDGNLWEIEAIDNIRKYLVTNLQKQINDGTISIIA